MWFLSSRCRNLLNITYFDSTFVEKWLEKDGKVPKKITIRGCSSFCEGYIFDIKVRLSLDEFLLMMPRVQVRVEIVLEQLRDSRHSYYVKDLILVLYFVYARI